MSQSAHTESTTQTMEPAQTNVNIQTTKAINHTSTLDITSDHFTASTFQMTTTGRSTDEFISNSDIATTIEKNTTIIHGTTKGISGVFSSSTYERATADLSSTAKVLSSGKSSTLVNATVSQGLENTETFHQATITGKTSTCRSTSRITDWFNDLANRFEGQSEMVM